MSANPKYILILTAFVLLCGLMGIYFVNKEIQAGEQEKRKLRLENECQTVSASFESGIQQFATVVAGLRSYVQATEGVPDASNLQAFLNKQLKDIQFTDSLVVSYLDKNHIFRYTFTRNTLTPNKLKGTSVGSIRPPKEIARLDKLMESDEMRLFPPINLVEGWVGIPLNFRLEKNGEVRGYFAPIINFESIIERVYQQETSKEFVYHFQTNEGVSFDRVAVYDGSTIYNSEADPESYKRYEIPGSDASSCVINSYDNTFLIGVSYKKPCEPGGFINPLSFALICLTLLLVGILLVYWKWQTQKIKLLTSKNQELVAANKALSQYAYASSHDLKSQLRTMGSFSSLLNKRYQDKLDEDGKKYLGYITQSAKQMSQMLSDLLNYTQLVNNNHIPLEEVDLNTVIQRIIHAHADASSKEIKFEVDNLPKIVSNRSFISQLFQNLVSNGLKYNESKVPIIEVRYKFMQNFHTFLVKDNGIGIPSEFSGKIFEPFQRLHKNEYKGTGLGLAICQHIVEQLHGYIRVESQVEIGTVFTVALPANRKRTEALTPKK